MASKAYERERRAIMRKARQSAQPGKDYSMEAILRRYREQKNERCPVCGLLFRHPGDDAFSEDLCPGH